MKVFWIIVEIVAALAAIVGVVYVIIAYGSKIVDWAKNLLGKKQECEFHECEPRAEADESAEAPAEGVVEAEEKDFEG